MDKKWILAILVFILFFMVGGIYIFSNQDKEKSETTNSQNNEEALANHDSKEKEENDNSASSTLNEAKNNSVDDKNNSSENTDLSSNKDDKNNVTEKKIVNQVSPSGFMGSSLYRVELYSNGDVYVKKFDGNGYKEANLISNDLIARGVEAIEAAKDEEHYGEVFVRGGELLNSNFGWISSK